MSAHLLTARQWIDGEWVSGVEALEDVVKYRTFVYLVDLASNDAGDPA